MIRIKDMNALEALTLELKESPYIESYEYEVLQLSLGKFYLTRRDFGNNFGLLLVRLNTLPSTKEEANRIKFGSYLKTKMDKILQPVMTKVRLENLFVIIDE